MNSFNTDAETKKIIQKYASSNINITAFNQSRYPRIHRGNLRPVPTKPSDEANKWYPPGHGDLYAALEHSGLLDNLISRGIEYLFVSNIDNLGATVDLTLLQYAIETQSEFIMEVTDKTKADIKGGTLVQYNGEVRLLEIAQVPTEHRGEFMKRFKVFNTNNLWISTHAIKRILASGLPDSDSEKGLEVIANPKQIEGTGEKVIQLETAVGAAIRYFNRAHGVNVSRSRFLPVKSCSDLFLVQSDLYVLSSDGSLQLNTKRPFLTIPIIKLGDHFKKVPSFLSRFASPPHILELDHLTVSGDVVFGSDVILRGTVIIVANHGSRIDIPSGSVLEDKVVSGSLRIMDH